MRVRLTAALLGALIVIGGGAGAAEPTAKKSQGPTKVEVVNSGEAPAKVEVVNTVETSEASSSWNPTPLERECTETQAENDKSELCAQWVAAKATSKSEKWTFWALILNVLTLLIVAATFTETRKSTDAALKTLLAGRALVDIGSKKLEWGYEDFNFWIGLNIGFRNFGERPALAFSAQILLFEIKDGKDDALIEFASIDSVNIEGQSQHFEQKCIISAFGARKCITSGFTKKIEIKWIYKDRIDPKISYYESRSFEFEINPASYEIYFDDQKISTDTRFVEEIRMRQTSGLGFNIKEDQGIAHHRIRKLWSKESK